MSAHFRENSKLKEKNSRDRDFILWECQISLAALYLGTMSDLLKPLFIVGSGGFAQEVAWVIDDVNNRQPEWHLLGFVEDISSGRSEHYGRPILESYAVAAKLCAEPFFACGMGAPLIREKESVRAENLGWKPATLIHPSVIEARFVSIGEGCVIGAGSVLAPYARIGRHCVVNVQSTIGHNAEIGDYSVVSPRCPHSGRRAYWASCLDWRQCFGLPASPRWGGCHRWCQLVPPHGSRRRSKCSWCRSPVFSSR